MTTTATARVQAVRIVLERIEGPREEVQKPVVLTLGEDSSDRLWERADEQLAHWAATVLDVGHNSDRCDYTVTFANGETYEGFYFLAPAARQPPALRTHLLQYAEHHAGRRCLPQVKPVHWQNQLRVNAENGNLEYYTRLLDSYAIAA